MISRSKLSPHGRKVEVGWSLILHIPYSWITHCLIFLKFPPALSPGLMRQYFIALHRLLPCLIRSTVGVVLDLGCTVKPTVELHQGQGCSSPVVLVWVRSRAVIVAAVVRSSKEVTFMQRPQGTERWIYQISGG